jgi:hypothetical protein
METDVELDPLDAFMGDVVQQVKKEFRSSPRRARRVLWSTPAEPIEYSGVPLQGPSSTLEYPRRAHRVLWSTLAGPVEYSGVPRVPFGCPVGPVESPLVVPLAIMRSSRPRQVSEF